jgi:hypothetical protein
MVMSIGWFARIGADFMWRVGGGSLPGGLPIAFRVYSTDDGSGGLVYWRNRIRASDRPRRILDAVRQVVEATGVLAGRRRRVLDATLLEDAVATQDTVTQLVAAIRRIRRLVPEARAAQVAAHDYDRPGRPMCAWDDPQAKQALITELVNDTLAVLAAVEGVQLAAEQAEAVALLALVAGHDVEAGERPGVGGPPGGSPRIG